MNREQYRAQVDAVSFSPDFQARTVARLTELAQEKEKKTMKKVNWRTGLVAAAVAAVLTVGAYAVVIMMSPRDVAQRAGNTALAAAFESEEAIHINEAQTVGGYNVTLMGIVSGEGLSRTEQLKDAVVQNNTYAILAYTRTDGAAITEDIPDLTVSPLVEGYAPWELNAWTLGGYTYTFAQDGTLYYLLECDTIQPYAGSTVYLAVYPGFHIPPAAENFAFDEATGAISVKAGADVAMFTLPLSEK
ncbi:MAG: hypothetical protein K2F83_02280 [Oscillospiraceae bacterium]|nr:hypothetical protein [Oscillospiraceae bacterium]